MNTHEIARNTIKQAATTGYSDMHDYIRRVAEDEDFAQHDRELIEIGETLKHTGNFHAQQLFWLFDLAQAVASYRLACKNYNAEQAEDFFIESPQQAEEALASVLAAYPLNASAIARTSARRFAMDSEKAMSFFAKPSNLGNKQPVK